MSKIKMSAIALALAAACGLSATASAATFTGPGTNGAPAQVVYYTVDSTTGDVNLGTSTYSVAIEAGDNLVGRTTGMGVRMTFPAGVKVTVGTVTPAAGLGTGTGGSVSLASGGGSNVLIFNVTPNAGGLNPSAAMFTLTGVSMTGASALATSGSSVGASVVMYDPNTAATLISIPTTPVAAAVNPITVTTTANTSDSRIDVGAAGTNNTNKLSKVVFASDGKVNGSDVSYFQGGTLAVAAGTQLDASTGTAYAVDATNDKLSTTLSGNFAAFNKTGASVTLSSAVCSGPTVVATGNVNTTGDTVSFSKYTYNTGPLYVCFNANGLDAIAATTVNASTTFTHGTVTTPGQSGALQSMQYNGPVAVVYTFNPAGNSTQESFLRISNTGATGGLVTVTGVNDLGQPAAGNVSFNLAGGASIQLTSSDLQNGNPNKGLEGSLGASNGKWILTVTGEIPSMEVTNLNRNNNSGTVSNLGTPVSGNH